MALNPQRQLEELGFKLDTLPSTKEALIGLLELAASCLQELDQLPSTSTSESLKPFFSSIVKPELLKHQDRDVKLLVATCFCEITHITARASPYSDDVLQDIFQLIVGTFSGLSDANGPSFDRSVAILVTFAKNKSCIAMLNLKRYDLVNEMFSTFFAVASDDHPGSILSSIRNIMCDLLKEIEDVQKDLLCTILSTLGQRKNGVTEAARSLAMNVIRQWPRKILRCFYDRDFRSVDLILARLCLEGSRRQAKYLVHALAAIANDVGPEPLSVLYERLVYMLRKATYLPAVLQSLGCLAQTAMPVFETRREVVEKYVIDKILKSDHASTSEKKDEERKKNNIMDDVEAFWAGRSNLCILKVYGIKTMVKSYLAVKDNHVDFGIDVLLNILENMLTYGEISKDTRSSSVDKAHLRLAAAKAIIRLSRLWDHKIPVSLFYLTLGTSKIKSPQVKMIFLSKVHQYIRDGLLDTKYCCAFILSIFESKADEFKEIKQYLADSNSAVTCPKYILPYIVHALAHHSCPNVDECKDVKSYDCIYRQLHLILLILLHRDEDAMSEATNNLAEIMSAIVSTFQSIKLSEDIVDTSKSKNSYALCDLGLAITKRLVQKEVDLEGLSTPVSLPSMLYKAFEKKEGDDSSGGDDSLEGDDSSGGDDSSEGDDSSVSEIKTWLVAEGVLAHFESLEPEMVSSKTPILPVAIIDEILKRLPANCLHIFRVVCKEWFKIIDSEDFIVEHLDLSRHKGISLFLEDGEDFMDGYPLHLRLLDRGRQIHQVHISDRFHYHENAWVVGSCNGLLCFRFATHNPEDSPSFVLCNPSTKSWRRVKANTYDNSYHCIEGFGGFSKAVNNYKIVRIHHSDLFANRVEVFPITSVSPHGWREIDMGELKGQVIVDYLSVTTDGFIFWIGTKRTNNVNDEMTEVVVSFDVANEIFKLTPIPVPVHASNANILSEKRITVYENKPAILSLYRYSVEHGGALVSLDLWLMVRGEVWINKYSSSSHDPFPYGLDARTVWGNDIVCKTRSSEPRGDIMHFIDISTGRLRFVDATIPGFFSYAEEMWNYTCSLMSPYTKVWF